MEPKTSSPSKLVIVLLILIVSAGGYLGYALYRESAPAPSENTAESPSVRTTPSSDTLVNTNTSEPASNSEMMTNDYTLADVAENNTASSCWTIINGSVYDITSYIPNHPGGVSEISQICGKDGSELFAKPAQHISGGAKDILSQFEIGKLVQ